MVTVPPRVLFMHGLEAGRGASSRSAGDKRGYGRKAQALMDLFGEANVATPDMAMSAFDVRAANSPARYILAYALLSMAVLGCCVWADLRRGVPSTTLLALTVVCGVFLPFARWRVKASFEACVKVQSAAIAKFKPTVVVASSWGGACALRCCELGHWRGPTVVIAPAVKACGWSSLVFPSWMPALPASAAARIVCVVGDNDKTISPSGVERMCRTNKIANFEVARGGDHRMNNYLLGKTKKGGKRDGGKLEELVHRALALPG
eukprot:CAMPEP_0182536962 /NCGR_PEP_ID=MMETSP1323-20130603/21091_1 /TAXON_ID=236787 /ORGANISM="Florenciella parvula, Strain RCC1693" /LENGTH=262 /DNA_ID=CAMNT_0024747267 /DNA_START=114 /DNA_END=902 /DNA_ORIENTATION=-